MTLLIFTHIDTRHHVLIIEEELCKSFCKLSLADTCGSHEKEGSDRTFLILKTGSGTTHSIRNRFYCHILADNPLVKLFLHTQKLRPFALKHPLDWNTSPLCNNLGNILRSNRLCDYRILYF